MTRYKLEFIVDRLPPLPNETMYRHWAVKRKIAQDWKQLIYLSVLDAGVPVKPLRFARVTLTRCSSRRPDWDNLASSFKHVLDGLIEARVLEDDSPNHIGCPLYQWRKTTQKAGHIVVCVEEINEIYISASGSGDGVVCEGRPVPG